MTTTPMRRSTRVAKAPERLAAGSTTPRKRGKTGGPASAFAHPTPTSKRQRTGRGKRAARPRDASDDESTEEAASSSNEDGDEAQASASDESGSDSEPASDFEQPRGAAPRTPRKVGRRSAVGAAKARKAKTARAPASSAATGGEASLLLDALLDDKTAVAQVAMDWIDAYRRDADAALCELVNFVIRLTGCRARIDADALYETDEIAGVLEGLQEQTIAALKRRETDADADDLLLGRTKEQRRLRKSALQMVQQIVIRGQHQLVFADVSDSSRLSAFSEAMLQWLASMAGSSYRPFRHVATLVSLAVQTALVSIRAQISGELQTAQRQLEAEQRRGRRRSGAGDGPRAQVAELTTHDEVAAAAFDVFYSTVFIFRYRDVHAAIRAECLVPLASWCRALPTAYLDTEHLRFLGWSLNDKDARVRETVLSAISGALVLGKAPATAGTVGSGVGAPTSVDAADASVAEGIRPFIVRFLPRLVQVAAGDVDSRVQVAALKLVTLLAKHGYVDATAKIGDIRNVKPPARPAGKRDAPRGTRRNARSRSAYSNSLSQQLLEESDSESEASDAEATAEASADLLSIQVLDDSGYEGASDDAPLACPRHPVMRYLAPLVAHTQASVRAAAAGLVAWWLTEEWSVAARVKALGVDRIIGDDSDASSDEAGPGSSSSSDDAGVSVDSLLAKAGGRRRARVWLLFKAVGAFLWHVSRGASAVAAPSANGGADDAAEWWVLEQAASCTEELWAAAPTAVGLAADEPQHAGLAGATADGLPATTLDARIEAAAASADQSAAPQRLTAAAQALWHQIPELEDLEALAGFLAWDHSARGARDTVGARFALAAAEETALLQAFAVWAAECNRTAAERARRARSKKDKAVAEDEQQARAQQWQGMLVPLLARHADSPRCLLPLMFLAAEALDLQALFDAGRTGVIAEAAKYAAAALTRHGRHVRLARLAAHFLGRVDSSRLLPGALATVDEAADGTAAGELVNRAVRAAVVQFGAAQADAHGPAVVLRALIRSKDISEEMLLDDGIERLYAVVEQAAGDGHGGDVGAAVAALDAAFHFVLWRALRLDRLLGAEYVDRALADEAAEQLQHHRDRIVSVCTRLVDSSGSSSLLREHAFRALGRVLRLFTGPLTHAADATDLRRALAVPPQPGRLASFYEAQVAQWAQTVARLSQDVVDGDDVAAEQRWLQAAPSAWSIAYGRMCAVSGLWAQWLGDQTVAADGLAAMAAHTGMLGLEPVERRRVELALGHDEARAVPRRKVGFVPLSAFDHIVQAAVDALKPQLELSAQRDRAAAAYMAAMRASLDQNAEAAGSPQADAVNVATLARFVGSALRATGAASTAAAGRRGGVQLAPAAVGAAWAQCHAQALDAVLPDGASCDALWEARGGPWFVALAQTVHGVLRPRHAETLDAHLRRCCDRAADPDAARAAAGPYQRALDKELAKLGAIRARMAEVRGLDASAMELPTSPTRPADDGMEIE
ncbi:cohesin complex subunit [Coemansia spiralis]|nr:cohesin complex subunit [Coemansia spiralis]